MDGVNYQVIPRLFFLSLSKCHILLIRCGVNRYSRAAFIGNFAFICGIWLREPFIQGRHLIEKIPYLEEKQKVLCSAEIMYSFISLSTWSSKYDSSHHFHLKAFVWCEASRRGCYQLRWITFSSICIILHIIYTHGPHNFNKCWT